jgi:tRNA threonylcarbamoyladenosine biosynthesis protein TsaE
MWRILSESPDETKNWGKRLSELLKGDEVIALSGDLGSGKTTFVKGLALGLGVSEEYIGSPSFTILNEYQGRLPLFHFDFYRVQDLHDLEGVGFWDYLGQGVVVVEWASKIPTAIPEEALWVYFEFFNAEKRYLTFEGKKGRGRELVEGLSYRAYNRS